jgi:HPt (histidine-containing phosphotransfer) domain-containing protein
LAAPAADKPAKPVNAPQALVDHAYLLAITDGDGQLLADMLGAFKAETDRNREGVLAAIRAMNKPEFDRLAHRLRSSLSALALLNTAEKLKVLEEAATLSPTAEADVQAIWGEMHQGVRELERMVDVGMQPELPR